MRRTQTICLALVALLAISATAAGTASATKLELSDGGVALIPGASFSAYGEENLTLHTSLGFVECVNIPLVPTFGMRLGVVANSKAQDELSVNGTFGEAGDFACRGGPNGRAAVTVASPGSVKLASNGNATEGHPFVLRVQWERGRGPEGHAQCYFKSHKLKGGNSASTSSEPLYIEFINQKLRLDTAGENSEECPKEATLSFYFDTTEDEEAEENRIEEHTF